MKEIWDLIQINYQPDAKIFQFIILTFIYSSTCFGRFPAHHQELDDCSGSLCFYLRIVVTVVPCSWLGQDNKLKNCCIWLVIYLNCTMMHRIIIFKCEIYIMQPDKWLQLSVRTHWFHINYIILIFAYSVITPKMLWCFLDIVQQKKIKR